MRSRDVVSQISAQDLTEDVDCIPSSLGPPELGGLTPRSLSAKTIPLNTEVWGKREASHAPLSSAID